MRHAADLAAMFFARSSGILVSLVFLPWYAGLMSTEDFGLASLAMTIQAAVLMVDLGLGNVLSREIGRRSGSASGRARSRRLLQAAEMVLIGVHLALLLGVTVAYLTALAARPIDGDGSGALTILFVLFSLFLVLQHIFQLSLLAMQRYWRASTVMVAAFMARALATLVALLHIEPSIEVFLGTQIIFLTLHYLWVRLQVMTVLRSAAGVARSASRAHVAYVFRQAVPFFVMSASGVLATQGDKPLVAAVVGAAALAPYYLAYTYAQALLSVVSAPISQFFHPKIMAVAHEAVHGATLGAAREELRLLVARFAALTAFAAVGAGLTLTILAPDLIALWLGDLDVAPDVVAPARVLLIGSIVMSTAFVPFALLTALEEAAFMARAGAALCMVAMPAYVLAAMLSGVMAVASVMAAYQVVMTVTYWRRILHRADVGDTVRGALRAMAWMVLAAIPSGWVWAVFANAELSPLLLIVAFLAGSGLYACMAAIAAWRLRLI